MRVRACLALALGSAMLLGACGTQGSSTADGGAPPPEITISTGTPTGPPSSGSPQSSESSESSESSTAATPSPTQTPTSTPTPTGPPRTSCRHVGYIGESTSLGLVSPWDIPHKRDRLVPQLRQVGVQRVGVDILGARSIIEKWHDQPNAQDAAHSLQHEGFGDCWIIAMGTNEAANQAAGSTIGSATRIALMMHILGRKAHVLWPSVRTVLHSGYYREPHMAAFDQALRDACRRYPHLRVYSWAREVHPRWYLSDGIHFTPYGYQQRAHRFARALARAFPRDAPPAPSCLVSSGVRG